MTSFLNSQIVFAQDTPVTGKEAPASGKDTPVDGKQGPVVGKEKTNESLAWKEYPNDVQAKYKRVMDNVQDIRREAAERKIDNPDFREALVRFETHAKAFGERLKNAGSVAPERQEKFRKQMRSDLKKLNKEYNRLMDRWAKIRAQDKAAS